MLRLKEGELDHEQKCEIKCELFVVAGIIFAIVEAIRSVMQGGFFFSQSVREKMAEFRDSAGHLTSRELKVLELVGEGNSNVQIGDALNISERTVRSHMESIMQKMQVHNRTEVVTKAIHMGWIKIENN